MYKTVVLRALTLLTLLLVTFTTQAAPETLPRKEPLVLMPLRLSDDDRNLQGAMEAALVEGLQREYKVYSGEQVQNKAREIFSKETVRANSGHHNCDETRCMQDIAQAFQAEFIAVANVVKQGGGYFLALIIQNIFDNTVVYSKSVPCEGCSAFKVVDKLKSLSGNLTDTEIDAGATEADTQQKIDKLNQEHKALEQKMKEADTAERKRLQEAKAKDEALLAKLRAAVDAKARASSSQTLAAFPTLESAEAEIQRLTGKIADIVAGYEKSLSATRDEIQRRYAGQIAALEKDQPDEFTSTAEFQRKQQERRRALEQQRDAEMARFDAEKIAADETAPLKKARTDLQQHDYLLGKESVQAELGKYDLDRQQFDIRIKPVQSGFFTSSPVQTVDSVITMTPEQARTFKQQWQAGLIRVEEKIKPGQKVNTIRIVNDSDNSQFVYFDSRFIPESGLAEYKKNKNMETMNGMMVTVPGGSFEMGSGNGDELPQHRVTLKAFALGKYEVTQAQWQAVMGDNPSNFKQCGGNCPVENVSWNDAQAFIQKLNQKTGANYRLPTEAEWEYACKAGQETEYCGGNNIDEVAWYGNNSQTTHPVGQKQANAFGLYDMSGNAWEWVQDSYHGKYNGAPTDGTEWLGDGAKRVLRGGSWSS